MDMKIRLLGGKKVAAEFDSLQVMTDQPVEDGGTGTAPAPFDLFLASIGTCAGFYVQSFCATRAIDTAQIAILMSSHWDEALHLYTKIEIQISLPPSFPEKYRQSLVSAVNQCSVKKHLLAPPQVEIALRLP